MIITLVCIAIISYLVAGVNGAITASRIFHHQDIRELGSKNPGFTNYKRVYGNGIVTWLVMVFDILKAAVCVGIAAFIMERNFGLWQLGAAYAGLFCMLGHCFPIWYKFKGGKAFMTGFATTWFVDWRMALIAMAVFLLVLEVCKYMSVSSCIASITCPITLYFLGFSSWYVWGICLASALLVIARHKNNFVKLANGTESKFSVKSKI